MDKVNEANYFSTEINKQYFSASQVKSFMDCEARTLAEIRGEYERPTTVALQVGSYVDAFYQGDLDVFKEVHPEIFNKRTGELKADYQKANDMIERAESDPVFKAYMDGEKQRIFTGTIAGVPFKAKLDVYKEHVRIVDLKTCRDFAPVYVPGQGRVRFDEAYYYPMQMAIYQELVYQNTGEKLPVFLACITKEDPSDIGLFQYSQAELDAELEILKKKLPRYDAIKNGILEPNRCCSCAYCRQSHKLGEPIMFEVLTEEE